MNDVLNEIYIYSLTLKVLWRMKNSQFMMKNAAQRDHMTLLSNENANDFRFILLVTSFIMSLTKKGIPHVNIVKVLQVIHSYQ